MNLLLGTYQFLSNGTVLLWLLLATFVFMAVLFPWANRGFQRPGDPSIIDLQMAFTKRRFIAILRAWIERSGFRAIRRLRTVLMTVDLAFPIVYAAFGSSLIAWAGSRLNGQPTTLLLAFFLLPWLAAAFDYFENFLHYWLTGQLASADDLPNLPAGPIRAASVAAVAKAVLLLTTLLVFGGLLIFTFVNRPR